MSKKLGMQLGTKNISNPDCKIIINQIIVACQTHILTRWLNSFCSLQIDNNSISSTDNEWEVEI